MCIVPDGRAFSRGVSVEKMVKVVIGDAIGALVELLYPNGLADTPASG